MGSAIFSKKRDDVTHQRVNFYNIFVVCILGLGSVAYGYTASIIGTTLGQPSFIKYFELATRSNGLDLLSCTNGLYQAGGFLGSLLTPWLTDRFGRKRAGAYAALACIISGALQAGSVNIGMFLAFRFTMGFSNLMVLVVIPILMSEVSPAHQRGALIQINAIAFVFGYFIQGWVGFGCYFWQSGSGGLHAWRPPLAIQCFLFLLFLAGLPLIPESPRWLCLENREEEAERVLIRLHRIKDDPDNAAAKAEFYQIKKQIAIDKTLGSTWGHLLKKPSYRKRALIGIGTMCLGQSSGVLVINNYGPSLYAQLGFGPVKQLLYPAGWLTFAVGMTIMSAFIVERFSRPKYLAIGATLAVVTLIVEAALVASYVPSNNEAALKAAVAMLFLFLVPYALCIDGVQFTYLAEIFPMHIRTKGVALGVSMISLLNIIWLQSAPTAFKNIGWKYYLVFIIFSSTLAVIVWFLFPDTQGLPLEEVAAVFGDADEVAIYQRDLTIDPVTHAVIDHTYPDNAEKRSDGKGSTVERAEVELHEGTDSS